MAVALDSSKAEQIIGWALETAPKAAAMKIGLQAYLRFGVGIVEQVQVVAPQAEIFLDLKLHDIPATVGGAAGALASLQPTYLSVHASGGPAMIKAAVKALPSTKIAAVTVLTSLDQASLVNLGLVGRVEDIVVAWAQLAVAAGARAIVCGPNEVALVRAGVGADVTLITPGVRPADSANDDQSRVATPRAAQDAGADLLVIGRPITNAANPSQAIANIVTSLA